MFNSELWREKKERNSELCKDLVQYAEKEIMKWVNPQTVLSDREMRMIKKTNKILLESGILTDPLCFEDLVSLVKEA